jgi:hypothetical protein
MESIMPILKGTSMNLIPFFEEHKRSKCLDAETHVKLGYNLRQLGEEVHFIGNNPECAATLFGNLETCKKIEGALLLARVAVNAQRLGPTIDDKWNEIAQINQTPLLEAMVSDKSVKLKSSIVEKFNDHFERRIGDKTYEGVFGALSGIMASMIDNIGTEGVSLAVFGISMKRYVLLTIELITSMRRCISALSVLALTNKALFAKAVNLLQEADTSERANESLKALVSIVSNTVEICGSLGEANEALANLTNELHTVSEKIQAQVSAA